MDGENRIRNEIHRNSVLMGKTQYGTERWNILYAIQQALEWAVDPNHAMSPVKMFKKFKADYGNKS